MLRRAQRKFLCRKESRHRILSARLGYCARFSSHAHQHNQRRRDEHFVKARRVNPTNFLAELKRRNVYRAAVAYGVVAWFLTQLKTQVFPLFEIPNSAVRFVVIALAVGFPIAMLLSWVYEFTPEGIVRTEDLDPVQARSVQRAYRADPRLHHYRGAAAGYCNDDRWATPVLQADWRVDFSEKHRRASIRKPEQR